jgi:subtilase family serine protease
VACAFALLAAAPASAAIPAGWTIPAGSAIAGSAQLTAPPAAAGLAAGTAAAGAGGPAGAGGTAGGASRQHRIKVLTAVLTNMREHFAKYRSFTPGPQDIFDYQVGSLWKQGIDGYGTTVAVIEGWDDPDIAQVVAGYDRKFGLPNPQIKTVFPAGPLPAKCPPGMQKLGSYGSCAAWRGELELDVISAHLIAPYAKIVISATPADTQITDDAASQVAPPEMMKALEYISQRHLANAISISDGTGEITYSHGADEITAQDPGELTAAAAGIPVMVATGDCGVVQNLAVASGQCADTSATPDTAAWDDSPWVTAVGGSVPNLTKTGAKAGPDPLWHGSGAGFSSVFGRPSYQDGVAGHTGSAMRSVPDITMDSQDGTSEAAPLFAGLMALATQLNHGNVGPVNPALYQIVGPAGSAGGVADVVRGNDSTRTVPGFTAGQGFDVASGWGTVNASRFVPSLVTATRTEADEALARQQARGQLTHLEHGIQLSGGGTSGHQLYLLDQGFLPRHPVVLAIDGHRIATLTASTSGYVTDMISPAKLKLRPGRHVLTLTSMLLTASTTFSTG